MMHRALSLFEKEAQYFIWEEAILSPFDELIVSWSSQRPLKGAFVFQLSVYIEEWSPWLDYAFWGARSQKTFQQELPLLSVFQDVVRVKGEKKAAGFRIRVEAKDGASLTHLRCIHASLIDHCSYQMEASIKTEGSIDLKVPPLSQIALADPRHTRLCSPVSTTAVIHFLEQSNRCSPIRFAGQVWDEAFDIYGNWILNTAQASHLLGEGWHCYAARFTSFYQVIEQLRKGYPVVVSIKGPLTGSPLPYESGHLVVVKGFDSGNRNVLCMDPAFPTDDKTFVQYPLVDFITAWQRRMGLAYVFEADKSMSN